MGGMFDPVHAGHIEAAKLAIATLDLDDLFMVPCHIPNHREAAQASAQDRVQMLRLACAGHGKLKVDDREIQSDKVSYTVDTLASFSVEFPGAVLVLVLGADSFASLPQWYRWQAIFALAHVLVLGRPGPQVQIDEELAIDIEYREVNTIERFFSVPQGRIWRLQEPKIAISSTQVREALRGGRATEMLIDPDVQEYIHEKSLYQNTAESKD